MNFLKEFWLKETRCFRQHLDAEQQADPNSELTTNNNATHGAVEINCHLAADSQVRARVGVVMVSNSGVPRPG